MSLSSSGKSWKSWKGWKPWKYWRSWRLTLTLFETDPVQRFQVIFTLLLLLIAIPIYTVKVTYKNDYTDFDVYYRAATHAQMNQWDRVYTIQDGASPFRYAPITLPLFLAFSKVSLPTAHLLWFFLQVLCFGFGFYFLFLSLPLLLLHDPETGAPQGITESTKLRSLAVTCGAILFSFRFFLDSFTIGQVSSLMFFGYCLGLNRWVKLQPGLAGAALFVPTLFKIGPGFSFFLLSKHKPRLKALLFALGIFLLFDLVAWIVLHISLEEHGRLWSHWIEIVLKDSVYYDASHYGSQSVLSAFLRLAKKGWISFPTAFLLRQLIMIIGCLGMLLFWFLRNPRNPFGRAFFFSLGIFPYLWFMPETFKYSMTMIAIPIVLLIYQKRKTWLTWLALFFAAATLSLAGKDIVGDWLFFFLQQISAPLFATFLLALATFQAAWRNSSWNTVTRQTLRTCPKISWTDCERILSRDEEAGGEKAELCSLPSEHFFPPADEVVGQKTPQDAQLIFGQVLTQALAPSSLFLITADDWGLSPGVNQGILELAKRGIVRRVSCIADAAYLETGLEELKQIEGVELGLHLNYTYGKYFSTPSSFLMHWLFSFGEAGTRLRTLVRQEFASQLEKLKSAGITPVFLDGHHHCHLVPGLIVCLADLIHQANIKVVRLPYDRSLWFSGKFSLLLLCVFARPVFARQGFIHSRFFYPRSRHFNEPVLFKTKLSKLLKIAGSSPIEIIVHPAALDDSHLWRYADSYTGGRVIEYKALLEIFGATSS